MSWQYLAHALGNKNVVMAVSILETKSWQDLSRVEVEICNDKRLLRQPLTELELDLTLVLNCQFLNVQAFSVEFKE